MPEGEVAEKKRGRTAKEDKTESKKRVHEPSPKSAEEPIPENGSTAPKRGRGRPKGSKKATAKPKKVPVPGRGRGRPKASSNDEAGSDSNNLIEYKD